MIQKHPAVPPVEECAGAVIKLVTENRRAICCIYNSLSRNVFEERLMAADLCEVRSCLTAGIAVK